MSGRYGLEIRALTEGDAAGVAELLGACGAAADARALADRIARLRASPGVALGAFEWGPPSGIATAHWSPSLLADAPMARLALILVSPADRRRGVGRRLIKAAAQAARQAGCAELRLAAARDADGLAAFAAASGFGSAGAELARPLRRRS